ncbi:MAG: histidine--tRNA ligase [Clostridia bacterium]|nr:histidine--tRNA ligase [Clostridia bacterium]
MIRKMKGTMDIFPGEALEFRRAEEVMRRQAALYGYGEIRTPVFENTELFVRGVGEGTDVVQKEMFTWTDREEGRSISLRPEGTASVVRALIEHGKFSEAMPQKYFYIGSFFRHEAPQAGRSREFFQFGTELFGAATPEADACAISLASSVLRSLGLAGVRLHLNSIGCAECRPAYRSALLRYYDEHRPELCETCRTRMEKNPLRLLDCKEPGCRALAAGAPRTLDCLCESCRAHFDTLCGLLDEAGVAYEADPAIVRGLDYYTRTVFEFIAEGIGAQSTVCGGGRYDGLVASLGGPDTPAVGVGMGLTRVLLAQKQQGVPAPETPAPLLYIAALGEAARGRGSVLVEGLRRAGVYAESDVVGRSLKAQMKYADKIGARYTLLLGDAELESGRATLRDMEKSEQREIDLNRLADEIR